MLTRRTLHAAALIALTTPALTTPVLTTHALGQPAATTGFALVLGEAGYRDWPKLPACGASSSSIATLLRSAGYSVLGGRDLSNGATKAAVIDFTKLVATRPDLPTMVYVCGYAVSFDARYFVVPVDAALERPGDVLTQGAVARGLLNLPTGSTNAGLNLLDLYAAPGQSLDGIGPFFAGLAPRAGRVLAAAVEQARPDGPTPLAQAFSEALKPGADIDTLVAAVRRGMSRLGDVGIYAAGSSASPLIAAPDTRRR